MYKVFKILAITSILLFIVSCKKENDSEKLNNYVVDRIWITENQNQYYFSSGDDKEYSWSTLRKTGDGNGLDDWTTPFSIAKGNPQSNPYKSNIVNPEGWTFTDFFKIQGDKLILQREGDINAEDLMIFHLEKGKDTTIGVFSYNTLLVRNKYGNRIWKSKK